MNTAIKVHLSFHDQSVSAGNGKSSDSFNGSFESGVVSSVDWHSAANGKESIGLLSDQSPRELREFLP